MIKTIKGKFYLIFVLLVLLPQLVMGIVFSSIYKNKLIDRVLIDQRAVLDSLKRNIIDRHIEDMEAIAYSIATGDSLSKVFESKSNSLNIQQQWDLCRKIFPERSWIYYGSNQGEIITSPHSEIPSGYNLLSRPWYITGKESSTVSWTKPYKEYLTGETVLTATIGIKDSNSNFTGVLGIDTTMSDFLKLLKNEALNKNTKLFVISQDGSSINLNEKDHLLEESISNYDWKEKLPIKEYNHLIRISNIDYYHQKVFIPKLDLYLISLLPEDAVQIEVRPLLVTIYMILLIGVISAILAGFYFSRDILEKILKANKYIKEISLGNYLTYSVSDKKDEFSVLNSNIFKLSNKISKQINELDSALKEKSDLVELRTKVIQLISQNSASPLMYLYNTTTFLLEEDNKKMEYIMMHSIVRGLKSLNENIMTYLKIDEGLANCIFEDISLYDLTELIVDNHRLQLSRKSIEIDITNKIYTDIRSENFLLKIVLENLIDNAIKFSKSGEQIKINLYSDDLYAYWEIEDSGPGFTQEDKKLLYNKFQKLSAMPSEEGLSCGLGLYVVKELINNIGASIELVESNQIRGAKFLITFDLSSDNKG